MFRRKMAYHLHLCFYILYLHLVLGKVWDGPSLTSVNLRSILKWKTEEQYCDIELGNGTHWMPLHVPTTCMKGYCSADLSYYIQEIYVHYQAKVRCPRGNPGSQWNTSYRMQLYKDATVGPPLLNISLGQSQLDIMVKLPPAPWFRSDGSQLPIQSYVRKLGHLIISVKIGSQLWNTINTDIVESTGYRCLVSVPHIPSAVYCVAVSPKNNNGTDVEKKCEKAPNGLISSQTAVSVSVGIVFIVCLGILIWKRKCLRDTISHPKVLDFPLHSPPVTEKINFLPAFSLVHLENNFSQTKVRRLTLRKEYLENGFIVTFGSNQEGGKDDDWDLTEDSSEYSQEDMIHSVTENSPLYCGIPDNWDNSTNINFNSLQVMKAGWDLSVNEEIEKASKESLDVCNSSNEWSADYSGKEEDNCGDLKTNHYKRRSLH